MSVWRTKGGLIAWVNSHVTRSTKNGVDEIFIQRGFVIIVRGSERVFTAETQDVRWTHSKVAYVSKLSPFDWEGCDLRRQILPRDTCPLLEEHKAFLARWAFKEQLQEVQFA